MVIGIGGVSNAGKSTLASRLKEKLIPLRVSVLCQDDFARPTFEIPQINGHVDWELPESIDLAKTIKRSAVGKRTRLVHGTYLEKPF